MIENNIYVGVYVVCSFSLKNFKSTIYCCTNNDCEKYKLSCAHNLNFCSCCGKRLQKFQDTILVPSVNQLDVINELEDLTFPRGDGYINYETSNNKHIYLCSNIDDEEDIYVNIEDVYPTSIVELNLFNSVNLFKVKRANYIKYLQEVYGEGNVEIKFGLINEVY